VGNEHNVDRNLCRAFRSQQIEQSARSQHDRNDAWFLRVVATMAQRVQGRGNQLATPESLVDLGRRPAMEDPATATMKAKPSTNPITGEATMKISV
jgi:hypothetical protein